MRGSPYSKHAICPGAGTRGPLWSSRGVRQPRHCQCSTTAPLFRIAFSRTRPAPLAHPTGSEAEASGGGRCSPRFSENRLRTSCWAQVKNVHGHVAVLLQLDERADMASESRGEEV